MTESPAVTYCANHPQVETSLRCSRCGKPICARCAILTPTGYRCQECVRGQQKVFETTIRRDYWFAFLISTLLAFLGSLFIPNFILFALLLSPVAGGLIAEAVRMAVKRRRSPRLFKTAALGALIGALPLAVLDIASSVSWMLWMGSFDSSVILSLIGHGLYITLVTTSTFYRLSGLQLRK